MSYVRQALANVRPVLVDLGKLPKKLSKVHGRCNEVLDGVSEVLAQGLTA